jgi:hypothetical protein
MVMVMVMTEMLMLKWQLTELSKTMGKEKKEREREGENEMREVRPYHQRIGRGVVFLMAMDWRVIVRGVHGGGTCIGKVVSAGGVLVPS